MQYLYRAFDSDGQLLYVGISGKWSERLHQHERDSAWMQLTDYVKIERFDTREEVAEAERFAVQTEKPVYNKQYSTTFVHPINHWADVKRWIKSGQAPDDFHAMIVKFVRSDAEVYEKKIYQIRAAGLAFLFLDNINFLESHGESICRNCLGITKSKQLSMAYKLGEYQLLEGMEDAIN